MHSTDAAEHLGKSNPALKTLQIGGSKQLSLQHSPMNQTKQYFPRENTVLVEALEPSATLSPLTPQSTR